MRIEYQLDQAIALHQQGHLVRAKAAYENILKAQPEHFDALHLLGVIAIQTNQHRLAVDLIGRAIAINPNDAAFFSNRGVAFQELKLLDAAVASYDKAIAIRPDDADVYSNRGNALQELKQLEAAVASYDNAIAVKPDYAEAHNNRGNALQGLRQLEAAVASYDRAIAAKPDYAEAHYNRGTALQELKQPEAAVASFDKAIALKPDYVEAYGNRGNALQELMQLEDAVSSYDTAIALNPGFADAYNNRGTALHGLKQLEAALASYETAIALRPDFAEACSNLGTVLRDLKRPEAALENYDKAITIKPDYAAAYSNRGNALRDLKRYDAAIESYDKAIALNPDFAETYHNRGTALYELKQFEAALESYDKAIVLRPDFAEAYNNRGTALHELKQFEAALASYDQAIALRPDFPEACSNLGTVLRDLKRPEAAIENYDKAIAIKPDYAEAHSNRGNALRDLKRLDDAIASYDKAIALKPDYAEAYSNRGDALKERKQPEAALANYDQAIALKPDYAEAYSNRGVALQELQQPEAAVASFDKAIAIGPDSAETFSNRGSALLGLAQLDAAIASCDKAISIKPDFAEAYLNKSMALLLKGNIEQGFELYEWRWKTEEARKDHRNFMQPLWLGQEALQNKTILLHSEQGLGDTIQFCRYAKLVADRGANVVLEVPKPLIGLLQGLAGVSELVEIGEALPAFDYRCPLLSLPLAFKTTLDTIPNPVAYLKSRRDKIEFWAKKLGEKTTTRVGLVWSGGTAYRNDRNRSIDLASLLPHLPCDYDYVCLQKELRETDRAPLQSSSIRFFGDEQEGFADAAALCNLMDVVISVDTAVAHVSGALGKATWVLLAYSPHWPWMLDRDDSPWYPSVRLYRQNSEMNWNSVFERVRNDLLQLNSSSRAPDCGSGRLSGLLGPGPGSVPNIPEPKPASDVLAATFPPQTLKSQLDQAIALHQQGHLARAQAAYENILKAQPEHFDALHLLGVIAIQTNQHRLAVDLIGQAIAINPNDAAFYSNRGVALQELKLLDAAVASYDKAIAIRSDDADVYSNRGNVLQELKQLEAAVASYDKAIAAKPDYAEAHYNRGTALQALKQPEAAVASYDKALAIKRDYAEAYSNRGNALQKLKQLDAAVASYDKAVAIKPDFAEAYSNRGVAMQDLKQLEAAIASFDKAVALKPDYAEAYSNRGVALQQHNQIDAALASYDKAVAINPDYAQAYLNKGMALLLKGNIEQGFELYEWRWKIEESRKDHRNFMQPLWLGQEALQNKTILLYSEQGLGDTIQFCRYTKLVADRGANVVLEVPKPLLGLLQGLAGVSEVVEMGAPLPAFDFHCPLLSLPLAYKTTLDTIPNPVAYLQSRRDKFEFWAKKLGEKTTTRVGLVWSGSTSNKHYHDRSLDLELLLPHLPGKYDYICLQKELREVDRVPLRSSSIRFFGDELNDFTDTAALCDLMDVVISIDTSVAHLSGALGKATWVLLPYVADWRWMLDRDDSPWYTSVRLYRQNSEMTWNSVFETVRNDLLQLNSYGLVCGSGRLTGSLGSKSGGGPETPEPKSTSDAL